jgi:hypothetical protein
MDLNIGDKLYSIRNAISNKPQITVFSGPYDKNVVTIARNLFHGRITRLCVNDSALSRSAFIAQYVHFCPSEEQKTSKVAYCCFSCSVGFYVPDSHPCKHQ